jgi:hypothetical protein
VPCAGGRPSDDHGDYFDFAVKIGCPFATYGKSRRFKRQAAAGQADGMISTDMPAADLGYSRRFVFRSTSVEPGHSSAPKHRRVAAIKHAV